MKIQNQEELSIYENNFLYHLSNGFWSLAIGYNQETKNKFIEVKDGLLEVEPEYNRFKSVRAAMNSVGLGLIDWRVIKRLERIAEFVDCNKPLSIFLN